MRSFFLTLALAALLAAPPLRAQTAEEIAFVTAFMDRLQIVSILEDREYCGYIARQADGSLFATKPVRGKYNTCYLGTPPRRLEVIANYHTHASFDPGSINEIPSLQDLQSDIDTGISGYVSTPGGRLWFSDHVLREVRQICGIGCLAQDPDFRPGRAFKEMRRYSYEELQRATGN